MDSGLRRSLQTLLHDFWKLLHFLLPLRGSAFHAAFPGLASRAAFSRRLAACVAGHGDFLAQSIQSCMKCRKSDT